MSNHRLSTPWNGAPQRHLPAQGVWCVRKELTSTRDSTGSATQHRTCARRSLNQSEWGGNASNRSHRHQRSLPKLLPISDVWLFDGRPDSPTSLTACHRTDFLFLHSLCSPYRSWAAVLLSFRLTSDGHRFGNAGHLFRLPLSEEDARWVRSAGTPRPGHLVRRHSGAGIARGRQPGGCTGRDHLFRPSPSYRGAREGRSYSAL